jgi:hypothetical protein
MEAIMELTRPYQREHYRLPLALTYPVMFSDATTIGEGKVINLSVFGCTIECSGAVPDQSTLLVRLLLPDQPESLPIEQAKVRWVKGNQVGLQFGKLERTADLRLHNFVWDRLRDRLQALKQEGTLPPYS